MDILLYMSNKKLFLISIIFILLTCGVVNASEDVNDTISLTDDVNDIDYNTDLNSVKNDVENSNLETSDEIELNAQFQNEILIMERKPSGQTFDDIQNVIEQSKDNDTIKLSGTYFSSGNPINFTKSLNICGENNATLDGRNLSGIFSFSDKPPITITNIKFINYWDTAISAPYVTNYKSTITIINCSFTGNHIAAAISSSTHDIFAVNCSFVNNWNGYCSGAINAGGSVINCKFINNSASEAIINNLDNVTNCIFINNSPIILGVVYNTKSVVNCSFINNAMILFRGIVYAGEVINCSFVNNVGISCIVSSDSVNGCSFVNNDGISSIVSSDSVKGCSFANNTVGQYHGIIDHGESVVNCSFIENNGVAIWESENIIDCIFINGKTGAIYSNKANIKNCTFINNTSPTGAPIHISGNNGNLNDCTFIKNTGYNGGAIYIDGDGCNINNCKFINNTASTAGAIYIDAYDSNINNCKFINNTASTAGAIYSSYLNTFVNNTLFSNNKPNAVQSIHEIFIENYKLINQTKEDLNLIEVESKINATFTIICSNTYFRFKNITATLTDSFGNPITNQRILIELSNGTKTWMTTDSNGCIFYKIDGFGIHNLTFSSRSNIYNISEMSLNNIKIDKYDYLTPTGQTTDDIQYVLDNAYDGDLIKLHGKYITGETTRLKIENPLIIEGDDSTEFDSNFLGFEIFADGVTIKGISSNIHHISGNGYSNTSVINCLFSNNQMEGAITSCNNLTVINCSFVNNSAYDGSAISYCNGMKIYNSKFINNSATCSGGAIHFLGYAGYQPDPIYYVFNCSFIGNHALNRCGAISNVYVDQLIVEKCYFINNYAEEDGVANRGYFKECEFINNYAKYYATIGDSVEVVNCIFTNNKDVYPLKNIFKFSLTKKEFTYNSGKTLDVKITTTNSSYLDNGMYVVVSKSNDMWDPISSSKVNKDGTAHRKISTLSAGTYYVFAYYYMDDGSGFTVGSSKIKINKAKPSVSTPKVTAKYKKSKYFKVTAKFNKKALKNLKIKIKVYTCKKYKTYTLKTDKKGIVKINTKKLKKGTHKVVITSGNSNYYISKSSKIIIKK